MKVKIVFDKEKVDEIYSSGWGISYLIDGKILFDTGEKAEYLLNNLKTLNIDAERIEKVIISHNHWDHRGGVLGLLKLNKKLEIFACSDFIKEFEGKIPKANLKLVKKEQKITKDIYTTGCFELRYKGGILKEQALILITKSGVSIICRRCHPGILEVIKKARKMFPRKKIYCILGGLHLMGKDARLVNYTVDQIKKIGVQRVAPSHCTGFVAINNFRTAFMDKFLDIKIGVEIEL
jgi:7,8-dihydropterin-6-yl-methyl-4-(beta-D-ribofuranosyl)aminobenzene 5'-phosphate synthase